MRTRSAGIVVDEIEATILRDLLAGRPPGRTLDIGCGPGRLAPVLVPGSGGYVGIDSDRGVLRFARARGEAADPQSLIQANALRLPFRAGTFATAIVIRLYHRFRDPLSALREVRRVLERSGLLIVAVYPRPTLATFVRDVWNGLANPRQHRSLTFARKSRTEVTSGLYPGFVETLARTRMTLGQAGFDIVRALGAGFEELPVLRKFPPTLWLNLRHAAGAPVSFPHVFLTARAR